MERYQTPRLFSVAFQIFLQSISILLSMFFSCPFGALFHSVSLPSCASQSLQTLSIPCFRDTLYVVRPYFALSQPTWTYRKMGAKEKGSDTQALAGRREKAQQRQHPWTWDYVCQEKGSCPVFAPKVPSGWALSAANTCSSGNNTHFSGQSCR